jgi:hypothetical protein
MVVVVVIAYRLELSGGGGRACGWWWQWSFVARCLLLTLAVAVVAGLYACRYLENTQYWGKPTGAPLKLPAGCPGPVLIYTGNEGPIDAFWGSNGFMVHHLAPKWGAALLFPEERCVCSCYLWQPPACLLTKCSPHPLLSLFLAIANENVGVRFWYVICARLYRSSLRDTMRDHPHSSREKSLTGAFN